MHLNFVQNLDIFYQQDRRVLYLLHAYTLFWYNVNTFCNTCICIADYQERLNYLSKVTVCLILEKLTDIPLLLCIPGWVLLF